MEMGYVRSVWFGQCLAFYKAERKGITMPSYKAGRMSEDIRRIVFAKMRELKDGNVFPSMGCRSFLQPYYEDKNGNPSKKKKIVSTQLVQEIYDQTKEFEL